MIGLPDAATLRQIHNREQNDGADECNHFIRFYLTVSLLVLVCSCLVLRAHIVDGRTACSGAQALQIAGLHHPVMRNLIKLDGVRIS
jgi:hypothetical protein